MIRQVFGRGVAAKIRAGAAAIVVGGALLGAVAMAVAPGMAVAAPLDADPTPVAGQGQTKQIERLERLFLREKQVLERQAKRLQTAPKAADRLQQRIDALKARGQDTARLEEARIDFTAAIAAAQTYHDTAQIALDTHAGFDADGKVTDRAQARQTVLAAGKAERDFHRTALKAARELGKALRQYVQSHRPGR